MYNMHSLFMQKEEKMKATTRAFGEIEIEDEKIITMEHGMIGFPDYKHFTLIYNKEKGDKSNV